MATDPANQSFVIVTLTPIDDALPEPTDTATFSILPDSTYEVGSPATTTLQIIDNDSITLSPTADAYVRDGASAKTNFGKSNDLQVKNDTGLNRVTYLKFDLSTIGTLHSAKLRLFGSLSAASAIGLPTSVFASSNTSWSETAITWSTRPSTSGSALATTTILNSTPQWYEWDITTFLKSHKAAGHKLVTLVLTNKSGSSPFDTFASREAGENGPQLLVG